MITELSQLVITKIHSVSTIYNQKSNARTVRKERPCWGLIYKYEGETLYKKDGKEYLSNASRIVLLPKGSSYEWSCTQAGHYVVVEFESDLACDEIFTFEHSEPDAMLKIFKDLERSWLSKKPFHELESIHATYGIILKAAKKYAKIGNYAPNAKKSKLAPAVSHILHNFTKSIKNDELAALCQISTIYFRKLFFEVYGTSPIKYIHSLRIRRAKEMLRSDYNSLSDVAFSLGYNSIYEFSKDFKKHTGVSPSKF